MSIKSPNTQAKRDRRNVHWPTVLISSLGMAILLGAVIANWDRISAPDQRPKPFSDTPAVTEHVEAPGEEQPTESKPSPEPAKPWPPQDVRLGPPAGSARKAVEEPADPKPGKKASVLDGSGDKPEHGPEKKSAPPVPPPPSAKTIVELARWSPEKGNLAGRAREILMSEAESPTLKLIAIQKVQSLPPEEAVPILVDFLETPPARIAAESKPTAVKALVDFNHDLADEALSKLADTSQDEHVLLAITAFTGKKRSNK